MGSFGGVASRIWRASRVGRTSRVTSRSSRCARSAKRSSWYVLHFAADDALVHRLVERDQRLLEELAQALADQQLRQVVLHFADAVLAEQLDRGLDISAGSGAGSSTASPSIDCSAVSASGTTAPARQPSDSSCLISLRRATWSGGIDAIAERVAQRRRETVAALPHVELLAPQSGDADDFADVKRARGLARGRRSRRIRRHTGRILAPRRCLDEDSHVPLPLHFPF